MQDIPCCTGCPQEPDETSTRKFDLLLAISEGCKSWKVFSSIFIQVELGLLPMFFPDGTWSYKSLQVIGTKLLCSVFTAVAGVAAAPPPASAGFRPCSHIAGGGHMRNALTHVKVPTGDWVH